GKGYQFELADKSTDIVVKPFFLFEVKDVEQPNLTFNAAGGKHMCNTCLTTDANGSWASASGTTLYMRRSGYRDEGSGWGSVPNEVLPPDYALPGTPRCALAHELGHSVISLWDDYITQEQHDVPSYKSEQRYPGVPFNRDVASIMSPNQTVRLRQMYSRVRWLNEEGKATKPLNGFLGAKKFSAVYAPPGKDKLIFELADTMKRFDLPPPGWSENVDKTKLGEQGVTALHLYPIGTDEFSTLMPDGPWDAMVVIDTRVDVVFKKGLKDAPKDWKTGDSYNLGDVADRCADYYVANTDTPHTAGADFDTDLGAFKWIKIDLDAAEKDYTFGTDYTKGDRLKKSGKYYVARKDFKAGAMDERHWMTKAADKGAWNTSQTYAEGELVLNGGTKYICTTAGPAGASFQAGNFMQIVGPIINYVKDRDFALGNQSKEGSGPV